jgi:hypothetical protein
MVERFGADRRTSHQVGIELTLTIQTTLLENVPSHRELMQLWEQHEG